jgi:beta-phosphoglucomutase-like phosphatase (HAD superfamily)
VATWVRHFEVIAATRLTIKPGAIELLDTLDDLGLPRAIATSSARETVVRRLRIFGQRDKLRADRSKKGCEKWA